MTTDEQWVFDQLVAKARERAVRAAAEQYPDLDTWSLSDQTMTVLRLVDSIVLYALEQAVQSVDTWTPRPPRRPVTT